MMRRSPVCFEERGSLGEFLSFGMTKWHHTWAETFSKLRRHIEREFTTNQFRRLGRANALALSICGRAGRVNDHWNRRVTLSVAILDILRGLEAVVVRGCVMLYRIPHSRKVCLSQKWKFRLDTPALGNLHYFYSQIKNPAAAFCSVSPSAVNGLFAIARINFLQLS